MTKFLRRNSSQYLKLGKKRKKKQVWRHPNGRHNKMRKKKKSYPKVVETGYKKDKRIRGTIEQKKPILIKNIKDLEILKENQIAIIGNIGKKKKIEILKTAKEKNIKLHNVNINKYLKEMEKNLEKKSKEEKPEIKNPKKEEESKK